MPYEVELPNGTIVEDIPDDMPKDEVKRRIYAAYPEFAPKEKESVFRQVADVPLGVAKGFTEGVRMLSDAFGADNAVSKSVRGVEDYLGDLMSAQAKDDQKKVAQIMREAEDKGVADQVVAGIKAFSVAPVDFVAKIFGNAGPAIIAGLALSNPVGATAAAVGVGATMGAGSLKGSIYDSVKEELSKTMPADQAEARAILAQEYGGKNLDQILAGTAIGGLASVTGITPRLIPSLSQKIMAKASTKGATSKVLSATAGEAIPEIAQEGQEQLAQNIAAQREGVDVPTWRGVAGAATLGGIGGGVAGAGVSAFGRNQAPQQPVEPPVGEQIAPTEPVQAPFTPSVIPPAYSMQEGIDRATGVNAESGYTQADLLTPGAAGVREQAQRMATQDLNAVGTPRAPMDEAGRIAAQQAAFDRATQELGYTDQRQPLPVSPAQSQPYTAPAPVSIEERRKLADAQSAQLAQAQNEPFAFDRRRLEASASQVGGTGQVRGQPRAVMIDPNPMVPRAARQRLAVLKEDLIAKGEDPASLAIVPHPTMGGRFAIEQRTMEQPYVAPPIETPTVSPAQAQQRIESAALAGSEQQRLAQDNPRQQMISRAMAAIESRNGVASPYEAQLLREANMGQPYNRIDNSLEPQGSVDERLTQATGIELQRTPRESVRGEDLARTAEFNAEQAQRRLLEQQQKIRETDNLVKATNEAAIPPQPKAVMAAFATPAPLRTAAQVATINQARARLNPSDVSTLEMAGQDPASMKNAVERIQREHDAKYSLAVATPEAKALADDVRKQLLPVLKRFGLEKMGLRLVDSINGGEAEGMYFKNVITLALDNNNPLGVMRHEVIHALKELGAFTDGEWKVLTDMAKKKWINQFYSPETQAQYKAQFDQDGDTTQTFDEYMAEEAIAQAFRYFTETKPPAGLIANLMRRLNNVFQAIREFFMGHGVTDAEQLFLAKQIFGGIESGRMTAGRAGVQPNTKAKYSIPEEKNYKLDIDREVRKTAKSAVFTEAETKAVEDDAARLNLSPAQTAEVFNTIKKQKKQFPATQGWANLTVVGIDQKIDDLGNPIAGTEFPKYEPITYGYGTPPTQTKAPSKIDQVWMDKVADAFTKQIQGIYRRADKGDKNALSIIAHKSWYKGVAKSLRQDYGAFGDILADLLGATSPNTPVDTNWKFSIDVLKRFARGDFDAEMQAFTKYLDNGGLPSKYPAAQKIRQISGKLYGMNSTNAMLGLADMWRAIVPGQAPKARNFALNLIGQSDMATIDVWAARMLRRVADTVSKGTFKRIPPPAEKGVTGMWNANASKVTGEFGFGAAVMDKVSKDLKTKGIDIAPPDLQAIAWFAEKELWGNKGWTSKVGEGGSFEENIQNSPVERYVAAHSVQQGTEPPSANVVNFAKKVIINALGLDKSVVTFRTKEAKGLYGGTVEESFDTEWVAQKGKFDPTQIVSILASTSKQQNQYDFFVSKVLGPNEESLNARPGVEIYFKNQKSLQDVLPLLKNFTSKGQDGFTLAVDPRVNDGSDKYIGVRLQYVPEISMRWDKELRKKFLKPNEISRVLDGKRKVLLQILSDIASQEGIAHAELLRYDTLVVGKENYNGYIGKGTPKGDQRPRSVWFGGDIAQHIKEAAKRYSDAERADRGTVVGTGEQVKLEGKASLKTPAALLKQTTTDAFKRWFGKSKVVNEDGTPKVMYHGTARDITEFRPKQAGAIFVTDKPDFAEGFSSLSSDYVLKETFNNLSPEEKRKVANKGLALAVKNKEIDSLAAQRYKDRAPEAAFDMVDSVKSLVADMMPTGQNIMPIFVRAENPFDYNNQRHVDDLVSFLNTSPKYNKFLNPSAQRYGDRNAQYIKRGHWNTLEAERVQDAIKQLGHDGFYVEEGGIKNLAVYDPNQIKSATGNTGAFSRESKDIRYSLTNNAPPAVHTKLTPNQTAGQQVTAAATGAIDAVRSDSFWTKLRNGWVDDTSGLAKSLSGLSQFADNKLRADILIHFKANTINLIKNGLLSGVPVLNSDGSIIIQKSESNMARSLILADKLDSNGYVKASKLKGGRAFVAEVARALRGADIRAEDAAMIAEGQQKIKDADALEAKLNAAVKAGGTDVGAITRAKTEIDKIRREGKELISTKREHQVDDAQIQWAEAQLKNVPEIQEIFKIWKDINTALTDLSEDTGVISKEQADKYRDKKFYVPLFKAREDLAETLFKGSSAKAVAKNYKLEGSEAIRNVWENLDKQYAMTVAVAYENQTRKVATEQLKGFGLAKTVDNPNDPNINLRYKEDGKIVNVIAENPTDIAAFQMMNYELGPIMKGISATTKALRFGALVNPMFWVKQLIRDPIHASLTNSQIITPFHSAKEFAMILANSSKEAKLLAERGVIGGVDSTVSLNEYLGQVGKEKMNPNMMAAALHKIMGVHEASDAATRVAIFKSAKAEALRNGKSEEEAVNFAVYRARESINFGVRGNSPILNTLRHSIPFFQAAITSLDTVYRAATGYGLPPAERKKAQQIFIKRAAVMTALSLAYAMMYSNDDEYKDLPDYVKDGNWLYPVIVDGRKTFVKIPVPFEIGFLFKTIPEAAWRYYSGTSTGKEVAKSYWDGLLHNLPGGGLPIPQAFKPALESITNHSFFTGNPIEGMSDQGKPVVERGRNASEAAKMLSQAGLHNVGLSPAKIDALIKGYFAELGGTSLMAASYVVDAANGTEKSSKNIENYPVVKAFMTDPNVSKAVSDFYGLEHNAKEMTNMFADLKKDGLFERAKEYVNDEDKRKQLVAAPVFRSLGEKMGKIQTAIRQVEARQGMDADEKRTRINELYQLLNQTAKKGYEVAERAGISR